MPRQPSLKGLLRDKAILFRNVFRTPEGIKVLEALDKEFNADKLHVPGDPYTTNYNLGRRDVVIYIHQLMRFEENVNLEG